jgi:hypothetical protein
MILILFVLLPLVFARSMDGSVLWRTSQRFLELNPLCEPDFQLFSRDDLFRSPFVGH